MHLVAAQAQLPLKARTAHLVVLPLSGFALCDVRAAATRDAGHANETPLVWLRWNLTGRVCVS